MNRLISQITKGSGSRLILTKKSKSKKSDKERNEISLMLALLAKYEFRASSGRRSTRQCIAVYYAMLLANVTCSYSWTAQHQLIGGSMQLRGGWSVEDDEERHKKDRRMDGWQPDRGTEWITAEAYQLAHPQTEMVNACDSDTQLCGQASDEIRIELSDGGRINVGIKGLRNCVDDHIPFVKLVKTKGFGHVVMVRIDWKMGLKDDKLESVEATRGIWGGTMGGITARADRSGADIGRGTSLLALMIRPKISPSH